MPAIRTCPDCGHTFSGPEKGQRIDRKKALETWDKLRDVQQDICWFLYRYRVATKLQIANAFFTAKDEGNRKNSAQNHINHLVTIGLVRRIEGKRKHHFRAFYTLTDEGMFCCQSEEKKGGRNVKKLRALKAQDLLDSPKWKHHLFVVDVMATFTAAERCGDGTLLDYAGDGEVSYIFPYMGTRRRLQPDATILWAEGVKAYPCWLELENRRASLGDVAEKIKKYVWLSSAGNSPGDYYRRTLGVNRFPPVLVVAVHRNELPGLRQAILRGVLGAGCGTLQDIAKRFVVGLACLDDIKQHGVLGDRVWEPVLQRGGTMVKEFSELHGLLG